MEHKTIVFIESNLSSGLQAIREIKRELGCRIVLVSSDPGVYLRNPVDGQQMLNALDAVVKVKDATDHLEVCAALKVYRFDAVMTVRGAFVETVAQVGAVFGLPHLHPKTAKLVLDKAEVRRTLNEAGVDFTRFCAVSNESDAIQEARRIGYPLIVKPVDGFASINVAKVTHEQELLAAVRGIFSCASYGQNVAARRVALLEEYYSGELVSAEVVSVKGAHRVLGITDRQVSSDHYVELGGTFPAEKTGMREIERFVQKVLDAIEYDFGMSHIEIMLTDHGPRLVEVNPRIAGGPVPEMMSAVFGVSVLVEMAKLHLGVPAFSLPEPQSFASIAHIVSQAEGTLVDIGVPDEVLNDSRFVKYQRMIPNGALIRAPRTNIDRLAYLIARDADESVSKRLASDWRKRVAVEVSVASYGQSPSQ